MLCIWKTFEKLKYNVYVYKMHISLKYPAQKINRVLSWIINCIVLSGFYNNIYSISLKYLIVSYIRLINSDCDVISLTYQLQYIYKSVTRFFWLVSLVDIHERLFEQKSYLNKGWHRDTSMKRCPQYRMRFCDSSRPHGETNEYCTPTVQAI